jgi:hypothetical protein
LARVRRPSNEESFVEYRRRSETKNMRVCKIADINLSTISLHSKFAILLNPEDTHISRKASRWRNLVRPIKQGVKNIIRIINLLQSRNWLNRRPENQSRE